MTRLAPLLLLAGWIALPWKPHLPAWAERWLYNPRERTERALEARGRKQPDEAEKAAETAHRLAPEESRTGFNAGTASLEAGHARAAAKLLEPAARVLDKQAPELAPGAWYNLGGAQLGAGDSAAAVEAYRQALLRDPGDADAKWNLELALQEREKERMRMKGGRQGSRGDKPGEREQSRKPGEGSPSDRQDKNPQDPGQGQGGQQQSQGQQGPKNQPSPQGGGRQPQFNNQPEMSAREAASLLSAVENLERRQRRNQAAQRSKQQAAKGKDW
ncbi:MAG: tetratricopeptide repeat protein [Acidobacteriota bacterium]